MRDAGGLNQDLRLHFVDIEATVDGFCDGMHGFLCHLAYPRWSGLIEIVVKHGMEGVELKALPILTNHLASQRRAGKDGGSDCLPCTVRGGDEIIVDEFDHHVELKPAPLLFEGGVVDFISPDADRIDTEFLLKLFAFVR